MYYKIFIIVFLLSIILLGFIKSLYNIKKYIEDYNFVNDYIGKMMDLLNRRIDNTNYVYLLDNAIKLSNVLGIYGVMDLTIPFKGTYKNYSIVNIILNYRSDLMEDELTLAMKSMQIYLGQCNDNIKSTRKTLKNIFSLFSVGFRFLFNIPLFILNSLGIISNSFYYKIKNNGFYYFIQNLVALIGLVSSIIGIIQGKEVLFNIYKMIING